ncbi:MAG: YbaB/EbfC family nucleoid-associated protein, partial [Acidobacteria bacterium]|nr:YbaB/EbfC family nucleoid-associated protein [Acidobacteriota bacterium]
LALWRGAVLPEFADAEFARTQVSRLDELRLSALEDRIDADLAFGEHAHVVGEIEGLTAQHPFRERFWELRMLALYRADRPVDALRAYDEVSRLLGDELAMEPGPRLRDLRWRIARRDPGLTEVRRPRIAAARVEPRTAEPFVGRQAELARLRDLLEHTHGGHRELATVVAEPGAGKSRLVAELVTWAWTRGCVVGSGRCFEAETGPPFAPVVECLVELVRSVDPAAIRSEAERPAAVVARLVPELHELLGELRVEGTAGGGMVTAELTGHRELVSLRIEKEAVDPDDIEMLQDLIVAAINDAGRKVEEAMQDELGGLAGGMGLPPGLL